MAKHKIRCDACSKTLNEDDINERILCNYHYDTDLPIKNIEHCGFCGSKFVFGKLIKEFITPVINFFNDYFVVSYLITLVIVCGIISMFQIHYARTFLIGIVAVPTITSAIIFGWFFLIKMIFLYPYRLGWKINLKLKLNMRDIDNGPEGIWVWLFGLAIITAPILLYLLGLLVRKITGF